MRRILLMKEKKSVPGKLAQRFFGNDEHDSEDTTSSKRAQKYASDTIDAEELTSKGELEESHIPPAPKVHSQPQDPKKLSKQQKVAESFRLLQSWKDNEGDIVRLTMYIQQSPEKTTFLPALTEAYVARRRLWKEIEKRIIEG